MRGSIAVVLVAALIAVLGTADEQPACGGAVPGGLAVPPGHVLAFARGAEGVQIYRCSSAANAAFAWGFLAPEATLLGEDGSPDGRHYAGPTWEAGDGSSVVGVRAESATPDPSAIPWLLLRASAHAGAGSMAAVSFVQRVRTSGGTAPPGGCDAAHAGTVARVPYRATYCFYQAAPAPK